MHKKLVILGAGGFAREVAWLVTEINCADAADSWEVVGFLERSSDRSGESIYGIPVLRSADVAEYSRHIYAVAAIGDPRIRERAVAEAKDLGCRFATLIHPSVLMDQDSVKIGAGSIVCAGNILTVNVSIGEHVILNLDCTIGHDTAIEDYVTISPGCHLSGYSILRRGAYLGTGAVTIERREIGPRATIGAGAVVTRDIPADVTAVGVPARVKEG
ncbi:MAG TPA: acetyltransferase [Anaerolineae bacterium]|nr:acetyltransferase [Anaerolineae bacterium]